MWAAGVYDLGLTDAQFWEYTPRQFLLLWDHHRETESRTDRRFASLGAWMLSAWGAKNPSGKPVTVDDLLPGSKPVNNAMSPDAMLAEARRITEIFGSRRRTA